MINDLLLDITRYFDYLRAQGYYVSFHNLYIPMRNYMDALTPYNINTNPFCLLVKSNHQAWNHCIERQPKVVSACSKGAFCGICYAGMGEFIFLVNDLEGKTLAFISVSGYRFDEATGKKRAAYAAQKYNLPMEKLMDTYENSLTDTLPEKEELHAKIAPLCRMFELLNLLLSDLNTNGFEDMTRSSVLSLAVVYLRRNYARNVRVEEVARMCHCSNSTLSHMFKKELGISVREYIRQLRIKDAQRLLNNTDLPIGTISDMLGFNNPNYFCHVFTQATGQSPTKYRQCAKTEGK